MRGGDCDVAKALSSEIPLSQGYNLRHSGATAVMTDI